MEKEKFYGKEIEKAMKNFYNNLNERDKRHFSAISTMQLPYGGKKYISSILDIDTRTIYEGKIEIENQKVVSDSIRKSGAGRKPITEKYPHLDKDFLQVLKEHTAGDPMNVKIIWTDLTNLEIVKLMESNGVKISKKLVAKLLKKHGYVKRKIQKKRR